MKNLYRLCSIIIILLMGMGISNAQQSVLNPDDSVMNYDPNNPPATPPNGTVAKWVRTKSLNWNTDAWKPYYYNGMAFRLLYPKTFKTNPNKKYPLLIFFHGVGEIGNMYDDELQLKNCGQKIQDSVLNGTFDAFVLFPQAQLNYWTSGYLSTVYGFVNYMANNVRLDVNQVIVSGLSEGGEATWAFASTYPKLVAAAVPMSAASSNQTTSTFINAIKDIPVWLSQGGQDTHPAPSAGNNVALALSNAGIDIETVAPGEEDLGNIAEGYYIVYPTLGHNTWDAHYAEPKAFQYMQRVYKSNPHVYFGRKEFCPGTTINVHLELTPGFQGYEWSKNGVIIAGANTNSLTIADTGTYSARILNGSTWSDWSHVPAHITYKATTITPPIQISGLMSRVIPAPDGNTSVSLEEPAGYASYQWRNSSGQIVGNDRIFSASQPGNYVATVTELYGCSANPSDSFNVASSAGPNRPDPATNVTGYAISQTSIQLNWSNNLHPSINETAFEIYRGTSQGGPFQLVGINPADSLSYVDQDLQANTKYYYIVRAVDSTSSAANASSDSILTLVDSEPPTAPSNLTVVGTTANSIRLKWSPSKDNASVKNYYIYINGVRSYITTDTSFTTYNLTHGATYTFVVKATDPTGNVSVSSNQVVASAAYSGLNYNYYTYTGSWSSLPDLSTLTPVQSGTTNNMSLSPATQATNYAFEWTGFINIKKPGTYTFFTSSDDGSNLYVNNTKVVSNDGLHGTTEKSGTYTFAQSGAYPFKVDYYQEGGGAVLTTSWQATSLGIAKSLIPDSAFAESISLNGTPPSIPTAITAQALSYDSVKINWTDNSSNETGFEIYRATEASGPYQITYTTKTNVVSYTDTTVSPSTTYYYKVQSINDYGSSGFDLASMGGLTYNYYESSDFSAMPDFSTLVPTKTGTLPNITLSIHNKATDYAIKFQGTIKIQTSGQYNFYTKSDDGSNLYIDGFDANHLVVNNNYLQGPTERTGAVTLTAGIHQIYITFFQHTGGDYLDASYSGPGINKQNIPDSVFANGHNKATTPALPPAPSKPENITVTSTTPNSILVKWEENSPNVKSFNVYRSDGNNTSYRIIKNVAEGTISYKDSGLYSNTPYYYKIEAINAGGSSGFNGEVHTVTLDNIPKISHVQNQSIRYDTSATIGIEANDLDNENLTLTVKNLPSFGNFIDYGDGTGLLTFTPTQSQQGLYQGLSVIVTDQHGGKDSTTFNLTVNDNYPPKISQPNSITVNAQSLIKDTIYSTDKNIGDSSKWITTGLPSFITASPINNGRNLELTITPTITDTGNYTFQVAVLDSSNGMDEKTVSLRVNYLPLKSWYLNFKYQTSAASPWNNITTDVTSNLKDNQGQASSVGLALQTTWWNSFNGGDITGNNSGVYPDNVIQDYYFFGIFGGPNSVTGKVQGLNISNTYSITFFASSIWTNVADNGYTVFQIGSKKDSIYVQANTNKTLTFHNITPASDGTITFTMSKGSTAQVGYLNAMVINTEASARPVKPLNIGLKNETVSSGNQVKVNWTQVPNASQISIYRSTRRDSTYVLLNPQQSNGNDTFYNDANIKAQTTYYYYLIANNSSGNSMPSDTISITTLAGTEYVDTRKWLINFKYQTAANAPWNNITGVTSTNLKDDANQSSGVGLTLQTTWWSAFNGGDMTGNNSGIYPDNVISDYYYFGIFGGPNTVTGSITGLDTSLSYSVTFFASSIWTNVADNGYTVFQIGSTKDSIYVQANTNRTLTFSHIKPSTSGAIAFIMSKGSTAAAGYINAMVVTTENNVAPKAPINLTVENIAKNGANQVELSWQQGSNNANTVQIFRSTKKDSTYNLINGGLTEGAATSYIDSSIALSTTYYYYLVANNQFGSSNHSDTLSITTPEVPSPQPTLGSIPNEIDVAGGEIDSILVHASVSDSSAISFNLENAPSFLTIQAESNGHARLIASPSASDVGLYDSIKLVARASTGGSVAKTFQIHVSDGGLIDAVYLNFTDVSHSYSSPWNNITYSSSAGIKYSNLIDNYKINTGISLTLVNAWSGTANYGINTFNNSGIFPDGVMTSYILTNDNNLRTLTLAGLDANKRYNIVLFGSSIYNNYNFSTDYIAGGKTITINNTRNKSKAARFNGLKPNSDGTINIQVRRSTGADNGLLNAMVIESYNDNALIAPSNLEAIQTNNAVQLIWSDRSYNETGFEIWRATSENGDYSKIGEVAGDVSIFNDNSITQNKRYFYKVRSKNTDTTSAYSNIASITTPQFSVYVNFNQKEAGASLPWNNTNHVPSTGDIYGPFFNSNGQNSNMTIEMGENFEGENNVGVVTGNNSGIYPDLVMQGEYYMDNGMDTIVMRLSNLNLSMKYDLTFFGSLVNFGWNNTTVFIVNNEMTALTTTNNSTETTSLKGIFPDQNGQITIKINCTSDSKYAILGAMVIQAHNSYDDSGNLEYGPFSKMAYDMYSKNLKTLTLKEDANRDSFSITSTYPNPFDKTITIRLVSPQSDELVLSLYNANGILSDMAKVPVSKGTNSFEYHPNSTIPSGLYILRIYSIKTGKYLNKKLIKLHQ